MISVIQTLIKEQPVRFGGLVAFGLLAGAYGFQFAGYPPCEMCWWQRWPHFAAVGLALIAFVIPPARVWTAIAALAILASGAIGLFSSVTSTFGNVGLGHG